MDVYDLDLDGPHGFAGFRMGWLILTRISCKCGWKGQARWPSGAGLDLCADELIAHQMRNRP